LERHPGATTQEARGKVPAARRGGEARERKRLEEERGLMHYSQKQSIRRFALQQADRMGTDPDTAADYLVAWAQRVGGYDKFLLLRDERNRLRGMQRKRVRVEIARTKAGGRVARVRFEMSGRSATRELMEQLAEDWRLDDWRWLFYH
jgi:hypothetical protein